MKKFLTFLLLACASALADSIYVPTGTPGYLTSSFGESRGARYHAGVDFSTDMREGFPVLAPENGKVSQVRLSPYGYGKVVYFTGTSGKTWVFAHQSGFSKSLDSLVRVVQHKQKKNDIRMENPKIPTFQKGDTLSYTGSSGIGNPHLHLELRDGQNVLNPCRNGTFCGDSLPPLILGAAVFQGEDVSLSGADDLQNGCLEIPNPHDRQDSLRFVFKIADYSRTPLENPMSVRRVSLKKGEEIIGEVVKDTLRFDDMIQIRAELLWAEEADTAGDWHLMPNAYAWNSLDSLSFEAEDMVGNIAVRKFSFAEKCDGEKPPMHGKFQRPELFTFLSRAWVGLDLCAKDSGKASFRFFENGNPMTDETGEAVNPCEYFPQKPVPLPQILSHFPTLDEIRVKRGDTEDTIRVSGISADTKDLEWELQIGTAKIQERVTGLFDVPWGRALAVRKLPNDSVPAFEFHPKGLHFSGNWTVKFDRHATKGPLYYLGETSRKWFLFSKQASSKDFRSASMNEVRDIGFIRDTTAPSLGEMREDSAAVSGKFERVIRIPVIEKESGIENGNAIRASAKGKPFIYAEYDSEPEEIVLIKGDLPKTGESFQIQIRDAAGNQRKFHLTVP